MLEHRVLVLLEKYPVDLGRLGVSPVHVGNEEGAERSLPDKLELGTEELAMSVHHYLDIEAGGGDNGCS